MKKAEMTAIGFVDYTVGEEIVNSVSHFAGAVFGAAALVLCCVKAFLEKDLMMLAAGTVYGTSLITLYSMSSIYHGLPRCGGKKVMRIIDHCTIYFLIAGTYTPVLCAVSRLYPKTATWYMLFVWGVSAIATVLTAIDFRKYAVFSMICYISVGWCIMAIPGKAAESLGARGFAWLLLGGILYSIGAVLYAIGSKRRYFHSIFHFFVLAGSVFQFVSVLFYVI